MSDQYLHSIYAAMGEKLDPDKSYFWRDSRFAALESLLREAPKGAFLDIGCGRGLLLRQLSDYHDCYGCDFDEGAVVACQNSGLRVCRVNLNASAELDAAFPEHFDVIVISEVCEHLLDPRAALQMAARHLGSAGTLIITVPNAVPLFARLPLLLGRSVKWLHYPSEDTEITGHIRFFTIESMSRLLESEGFSVESIRGVSFRMNGRFWERLSYWLPRLIGRTDARAGVEVDSWFGRLFPAFAPGLLFQCKGERSRNNS